MMSSNELWPGLLRRNKSSSLKHIKDVLKQWGNYLLRHSPLPAAVWSSFMTPQGAWPEPQSLSWPRTPCESCICKLQKELDCLRVSYVLY